MGEEEEEGDDEEDAGELILEASELGNLDPAVLGHLPPSVQVHSCVGGWVGGGSLCR